MLQMWRDCAIPYPTVNFGTKEMTVWTVHLRLWVRLKANLSLLIHSLIHQFMICKYLSTASLICPSFQQNPLLDFLIFPSLGLFRMWVFPFRVVLLKMIDFVSKETPDEATIWPHKESQDGRATWLDLLTTNVNEYSQFQEVVKDISMER